MSAVVLRISPRDSIIARDGRPFGVNQGNRMRGLPWPLPSVVAGSFRTALVKSIPGLDFTGDMPQRLMNVKVSGVFPSVGDELYLPAPNDCLWDFEQGEIHAVRPIEPTNGGADFPRTGLRPVMLSQRQATSDFKPRHVPTWWPMGRCADWLLGKSVEFTQDFLNDASQENRDHVCLDADRGAAAEGEIFATTGLNIAYLPRHGIASTRPFGERFAEVALSAQVIVSDGQLDRLDEFDTWHPLGGERRLVHWHSHKSSKLWNCPDAIQEALKSAVQVRMILATPAIFAHGWRPDWLDAQTLTGKPIKDGPTLKLVGVSNGRWKAVSGWSLAPPRGPKAIRRMTPAGSVYFFERVAGDTGVLATDGWLKPISDGQQDRKDGFGLATWGIW